MLISEAILNFLLIQT